MCILFKSVSLKTRFFGVLAVTLDKITPQIGFVLKIQDTTLVFKMVIQAYRIGRLAIFQKVGASQDTIAQI